MAYEKQTWEDRQVENPLTFTTSDMSMANMKTVYS